MKDKITNVLMVGVGGQGIILASDILTQAAMLSGYDVKKSEIHGMSQRGGSVFSHVRFGGKVHSPVIPDRGAHVLLSLELLETLRWLHYANLETRIIVLSNKIPPAMVTEYPEGIDTWLRNTFSQSQMLDPQAITKRIGNKKYLNVALLGLVSRFVNLDEAAWKSGIEELVPKGTLEENMKAFTTGKELFGGMK